MERSPDYDTHVMLGEALLAVQEPAQAVRAFEAALELAPRDSNLACRIGKALVATHDYQRAVDYFNKAVRNSPGGRLVQLARCCWRGGERSRQFDPGCGVQVYSHLSRAAVRQPHL